MTAKLSFSSLAALSNTLEALDPSSLRNPGSWSVAQVFHHCAQSIEYSLTGYPQARSALFRGTIGRLAKRKFLGQGHMSHDLGAAIPGAPALDDGDVRAAIDRLCRAIRTSEHAPNVAPHFAYGATTKDDYARLHAMHTADHLAAMGVRA